MIYIASFKSVRKLNDCCQLAISNGVPTWFVGGRYRKLAPTYQWVSMFKRIQAGGQLCEDDIEKLIATYYRDVLMKLDPKEVYEELQSIANGKDVVLLSQEASNEFSTRLVVKSWFEKAGYQCEVINDTIKSA